MADKDVVAAAQEAAQKVDSKPWPGPRGPVVTVGTHQVQVSVSPHDAGRISSIKAFGNEILRQYKPGMKVFQYGAFPMVPWAGRLGGGLLYFDGLTHQLPVNEAPHALHGLGRLSDWSTDSTADTAASFSLDISPWWPWKARAELSVEVKESTVRITEILSSKTDTFPGQLGLHPWFNRHLAQTDEPVSLEFYPEWEAEKGANKLPTGRRIPPLKGPWDDCFGFFPTMSANLVWHDVEMHITSSHAYATVFSVPQDAVCMEPQTSVPNALNFAPESNIVGPDRPLKLVTDLTFFSTKG